MWDKHIRARACVCRLPARSQLRIATWHRVQYERMKQSLYSKTDEPTENERLSFEEEKEKEEEVE